VFNVMENASRTFVSKSILWPPAGISGDGSAEGEETMTATTKTKKRVVRVLNTFAIRVEDVQTSNSDARHSRNKNRNDTDKHRVGTSSDSNSSGGGGSNSHARKGIHNTRRCRVLAINYLSGFFSPPPVEHFINAKTFFPGLKDRIEEHSSK
jgi:hypothetical protein